MVSKRREEESRRILESEKAMSNIMDDDRSEYVCPKCAVMTSLKKCPKCKGETIHIE